MEEAGEAGAGGGGGSEPEGSEGPVGKRRHGGEVGGGAAKVRREGRVMGRGTEERLNGFVDGNEKRWGIGKAIFHLAPRGHAQSQGKGTKPVKKLVGITHCPSNFDLFSTLVLKTFKLSNLVICSLNGSQKLF